MEEKYYSKSEQKTQYAESKIKEEGVTERYHIHTSDLNPDYNAGESGSVFFNSETEKLHQYTDGENYEIIDEGSRQLDLSENSRSLSNYCNINQLGAKRRSKSIQKYCKAKSDYSEDYIVENTPKNAGIDKIPVNVENLGVMARLSE